MPLALQDLPPISVTAVGGPTVMIEVGGVRLITDPTFDSPGSHSVGAIVLQKTDSPAIHPSVLPPIDAVLLSHDQHPDNFDRSGRKFAAGVKLVLTTRAAEGRLNFPTLGLTPWQSSKAGPNGELTIVATPARHGPPGAEKKLGDVIGFLIRNAARQDLVYVTGDTVFYDGVAEVSRRFDPQVVIAFAGAARTRGPFNLTMGNNDLLELARAFPRAHVIVVHNNGWAHFTEGPQSVAAAAATFSLDQRLVSLKPGETRTFGSLNRAGKP